METAAWRIALVLALPALMLAAQAVSAQSEDLGGGFMDHGVATPISNHRGTVATVDGEGNPVVLSWLMDHRGGYGLLMIDATTGEAQLFDTGLRGNSPFAAILSSRNRYYTHYENTLLEFDPAKPGFTFRGETHSGMAMSMTEDDEGRIWAASYPNSGVCSYNPETGELRDYGHVYDQNWRQYPRDIAADDQGWIYFGIGNTAAQIIILNPETGEATPVLAEDERGHGRCPVYRDMNGRCYASTPAGQWYELYEGQATKIDEPAERNPKPIIEGSQALFHRSFPTGERLAYLDLVNRRLGVTEEDGDTRVLEFDYESEGAHLMGLATASDGTICGGTAFPMRFFSYNPATDEWTNRAAYGQYNTVEPTEDVFYFGGYTGGWLLEWDPSAPWVDTEKGNPDSNPRFLAEAKPTINRPHCLLAYPDGRHVILGGTPGYGLTGGGLMIWDRENETAEILTHEDLVMYQSPMSLLPLPDGKLLVGTTVAPGTGGEQIAKVAEMFILDLATRQIEWQEPILDGVSSYGDFVAGPDGLVFGIADRTRLFVFDPETRTIVAETNLEEAGVGPTNWQQGPRVFVTSPDGRYFVLLSAGIGELNPETYEVELLAESPVSVGPGGAWHDGRIYFGHGSHMYSWQVPAAD